MAVEKENALLSDTEGGEKSTREQLKKASISHDPNAKRTDSEIVDVPAPSSAAEDETTNEVGEQRGRIQRKRSFEEVEPEQSEPTTSAPSKLHSRKRSRDSTAEEDALNNGQRKTSGERSRSEDEADGNGTNGGIHSPRETTPDLTSDKEAAVEALASPKTKRSRLHSTTADAEATIAESTGLSTSSALAEKTSASTAESKTDASEGSAGKIQPGSAFANTSSSSPFGALAGSKSPSGETTTSAFASSKFGALAGSSSSGFGALGKSSGGPGLGGGFASPAKGSSTTTVTEAPKLSGFGGALSQPSAFGSAQGTGSAFGGSTSGFGSLGGVSSGGFGGGLGGTGFGSLGGGGLSSFASGKPTAPLSGSSKLGKPFGAAADDDEAEDGGDEEDDGAGFKSPISQESDKQDERFYAQDIETGEEGEMIEMTCRAKLYNFAPAAEAGKKEWRERGVGILRLNVQRPLHDDDDTKTTARLLMRADGSHRVLLNTPILPQIKFGQPDGSRPTGSYLYFMGTIDDKAELQLLQLKVRVSVYVERHEAIADFFQQVKAVNAMELFDKVKDLQAEM